MLRLLILSSLVLCFGCSTRDHSSTIHPHRPGELYEAPGIDMSNYRSPQNRPAQDPNLAVAIAISGGGERAANFAAGVFLGLEAITHGQSDALSEIDYASTVSGGGMALSAYVASLHDHAAHHGSREGYSFAQAIAPAHEHDDRVTDPNLRQHLEASYNDVLLDGLFTLSPVRHVDRGDFLERSFNADLLGSDFRGRDLTLGDIFHYSDERYSPTSVLPFWVANATCYENGAMFPFTPDIVELYQITSYTHDLGITKYPDDQPLNSAAYRKWIESIPVSLAVTASGSFPGAVPAKTLGSRMDPKNPWLHLYDGGLADNLGILTALELLRKEQQRDATAEVRVVRRKVMLVVDAYQGTIAPFSKNEASPNVFTIGARVLTISLDSWRGRHRHTLRAVTESDDLGQVIHTVFFNFEDLAELNTFDPIYELGFTQADHEVLLEDRSGDELAAAFEKSPYLLARSIATSYDITPHEQRFLLAAGRYCVELRKEELREALGWPN